MSPRVKGGIARALAVVGVLALTAGAMLGSLRRGLFDSDAFAARLAGSLSDPRVSAYQNNHWIETAPTPKPSNAAIVNAHDFLLGRARACERERSHLPNIVAVDFYGTGDLMGVTRALNGLDLPGKE